MTGTTGFAVFGRVPWSARPEPFHQVASRLAARHPVVYVEFPRTPLAATGTARRREVDGLVALAPLDFPLQRFQAVRSAGARRAAKEIIDGLGSDAGRRVAVIYPRSPLGVVRALDPDVVVYHVIDDFSLDPGGGPDKRFAAWESEAIELADLVLTVSDPLASRLTGLGARNVEVFPNGFDARTWSREGPLAADVAGLPSPRIGFVGTMRVARHDTALMLDVVDARPDASFVFIGAVVGTDRAWEDLRSRENVHVFGERAFAEIPAVLRAIDVAVCPYADSRFNRGCSPLKILESLAMGVPVVATPPRPDLAGWAPHVQFVKNATEFVAALDRAGDGDAVQACVSGLSWESLTQTLERRVAELLSGDDPA